MQLTNKQAQASQSSANITIISGGYGMGKTTALLGKAFASDKDCVIVSYNMNNVGGIIDTARELFSDKIEVVKCSSRAITTKNGNILRFVSGVDKLSGGQTSPRDLVLVDSANTTIENQAFSTLSDKYKHVVYSTNVTEDSKSFLRKAVLFSEYNGLDEFCVVFDGCGVDAQPTFVSDRGEGYLTVKVVKLEKNQFLPDSYYENLKALPPEYKKRVSGDWK